MDNEHIAITSRRREAFTGAVRRGTWRDEDNAGLSLSSRRAETRSVLQIDAMDCHRGRYLADDVNFEVSSLIILRLMGCSSYRHLFLHGGRRSARPRAVPKTIDVEINGMTVRVSPSSDAEIYSGTACFEGRRVMGLTGAVRVMMAPAPVNFRKGAEDGRR